MIGALLFFLTGILPAESPGSFAAGDDAFLRIDYSSAIRYYEFALREHQGDPQVLWRLARVHVCAGEIASEDSSLDHFRRAEQYARGCILADSSVAEGHTWLAGSLGYIALSAGVGDQVRLTHDIMTELRIALLLNPSDDAAHSIMGSVYRALGNTGWLRKQLASLFIGRVPDGGFPEAELALRKAVALAPHIMRHKYELGVLLIDMGRNDEAVRILKDAATLPVCVGIDRPRLAKIHALLTELEGNGDPR